jgi:hypothetical protein
MSEIIQWASLTRRQRDELVAEKVMHLQRVLCPSQGQDHNDDNLAYNRDFGYWRCRTCNAHSQSEEDELFQHGMVFDALPRYSESLDAAWLVLQELVKHPRDQDGSLNDALGKFADTMLDEDYHDAFSEIFPAYEVFIMAAKWTPERICIAALKAVGVDLEMQ